MISTALTLVLAAGIRIWTEPSLVQTDGGASTAYASDSARIYAARGEAESFQLCYRAGRKGTSNLRVEAVAPDKSIPAPTVRLVGFLEAPQASPRAASYAHIRPDPLLEPAPVTLTHGNAVVYWVTYHIPHDASPGIYSSRLRLLSDDRRARTVSVRLEVFEFALPQTPSLPGVFRVDRNALRLFYQLDTATLADWTPFYSQLLSHRITPLLSLGWFSDSGAEAMKEHLGYLLETQSVGHVVLDAGHDLLPKPSAGVTDPLDAAMDSLGEWLDERGARNRVFLGVESPSSREDWPQLRDQCARLTRLDNRLPVLFSGPSHPFFERFVDRWATPFPAFSPELFGRFRDGLSLNGPVLRLRASLTASSSGPLPNGLGAFSTPEDACDASLFTAWVSGKTPTARSPVWFQLDLPEPMDVTALNILWAPGMESDDIEVLISREGAFFSPATVTWDYLAPVEPYAPSVAAGRFRFATTLRGIRLVFRNSVVGASVGIVELDLGTDRDPGAYTPIASIAPWLLLAPESFPSLAADALPIEARLIPWVCWSHDYEGFYCPALNQWPGAWMELYRDRPVLWRGGEDGAACLLYPGPDAPVSSIRLERLRDGMEDYEYLRAVHDAVVSGQITDQELIDWVSKKFFRPWPAPEDLAGIVNDLPAMRIRAGRALRVRQ